MSLIQSGKIFNDGEQLTAGKLNQILSDATLSTTGVDGSTIIVNENNVLAVRTGGIGTSSLANNSVVTNKLPNSTVTAVDGTPDGVTLPKLQHIETDKILGRTATGDGVVEALTLNTDNAMASASATTLASDGSIKAYVDTTATPTNGFDPVTVASTTESVELPNGLIMKFGIAPGTTTETSQDIVFEEEFPNGIISVQLTSTNPSGGTNSNYDYWYQIKDSSLQDKITIFHQNASSSTSPANNVHWLVIGY